MLPSQTDIELPLLEVLKELGGKGRPAQIYPLVANKFPQITDADREKRVQGGSVLKWKNDIAFARLKLVTKGEVNNKENGIWEITETGIERLRIEGKKIIIPPPIVNNETYI